MNSYRCIPFRFIFGALCFCIIASCSLRKIPASNDPQNAPESPERFQGIDLSDEQYFPTPNEAIKEFDSSFRQNSTEDIKGKLREVVDANQITFIGQSSHMRFSPYQLLLEVLPTVKEPISYIVLERPIDPNTLYPELSLNQNYTEVLNSFNWASPHQKYVSSCYSMEWANSITRFLPAIAEYNRQSQSKVQVISLDGHSTEDFGENLKSDPILEIPEISDKSNCQPQGSLPYRYVKPNSPIREQRTAINFTRFIKDRKSDKKKVVVLYHQGHLMRLGTQCRILATDSATFEASIGPGPFLARLWETEKLSEISSVVFIDEPGTSNAPNGHTKIAARGGTLRLGQSFAVQPNALSGVDQMKGSTMFMPGSDLTLATVKPFNKSYQIKDFFDLIIWVTGDQAKVLTRVVLPGCENSTPL